MNEIIRPLADGLGFDSYGQLMVEWTERGSTCSTVIADMRGKTCAICGNEWKVTAESFRNQTKTSSTEEWCHKTCMAGAIGMAESDLFYSALCKARGEANVGWSWQKIPNEYGGGIATSWYLVSFKGYVPKVKVGPRKRVYSLSMHDLRKEQIDAFVKLVEKEDVTKGEGFSDVYIHAWSQEKLTEYLGHFYAILQMDEKIKEPE